MPCKLHKVRFYNPKPESINCVSFNKINKFLALARHDASIEIWDLKYAPYLVKFIPGAENASIEALGWVQNRLLSTGLSGALTEWNIEKLSIRHNVILTGYAAWCLDINPMNTLAAIGTEQGYINLYSVENDEIVYNRLFDKQEGRIMCCKFDETGKVLVTGSVDTIRVWNAETGHATCRISVSRRGKETIVWCLAVLSDNIVVSGDSHGRLTFWDSLLGDQIESYTTHKADILSLAVSEDENSLYCSGVDPVIINFIKVNSTTDKQTSTQWVKNVQRNIHEHDVRALVINDKKLISVGADGYLTLSSYPPKWVMRVPPMIPAPRSAVCGSKKLLLLRYRNHLEVWKLGSFATNKNGDAIISNINTTHHLQQKDDNNKLEEDSDITVFNKSKKTSRKQSLKVIKNPQKLVSIDTKKKKQILCCDMSPNGEIIVYSTDSHIRMLKLVCDEDISLTTVLVNGLTRCDRLAFTEDSRTMVTHDAGEVRVLQVDPEAGATVVQTIAITKHLKAKSILHLLLSKQTSTGAVYLVLAGAEGDIAVWVRKSKKFEHHASLPQYRCVPSAMAFMDKKETLIVIYVDQKIIEYDLVNKAITKWPGALLPQQWLGRTAAVNGATAHGYRDALVCYDDVSLWIMKRAPQITPDEPAAKKKQNSDSTYIDMKVTPIKYLAGFHWIADDEAVVLEILPKNIVSQLPPALAIKRHNRE